MCAILLQQSRAAARCTEDRRTELPHRMLQEHQLPVLCFPVHSHSQGAAAWQLVTCSLLLMSLNSLDVNVC